MEVNLVSDSIKRSADYFLKCKQLPALLENYGKVIYTGSYRLNLMTWNDIDIQLSTGDNADKVEIFTEISKTLLRDEEVIKIKLINFSGTKKPHMPRGMHMGLEFKLNNTKESWKVDVWSLEPLELQKNISLISELEKRSSEENRKRILEWKFKIMKENSRPPQMASHFLYQAILMENLKSDQDIMSFLKSNNVCLA